MEYLSYGVDAVIVLVLFFVTYFGYKNGFVKTLVGLLSYAISLATAFFLSIFVADLITMMSREWFIDSLQSQFAGLTFEQIGNDLTAIVETFPIFLQNFAQSLLESQQETIQETASSLGHDIATSVTDTVLLPMFNLFVRTIVFILIFLIVNLGLSIIVRHLNLINHIPLVGGANKFLGLILGFIYAVGIIFIIVNVVDLLVSFTTLPLGDGFVYPLLSEANPFSLVNEFELMST